MNWDASPLKKCPLLLVFLLLACGLTGCITPQVDVPTEIKPEAYRKVYLLDEKNDTRQVGPRISSRLKQAGFEVVEIKKDAPAMLQGTGFVITPAGHLLTCAHVVRGSTNATVWINAQRYPCQVLSADTNLDLALLQVEGSHPAFTPLAMQTSTNYSLGQDAFSMGFPLAGILGNAPRLNKGLISATVGLDDDPKYVQFSAPVQPGNSGGPLLDSKSEVIGVIASTLNPMKVLMQSGGDLPQNVNFAIKMDSIQKFLAAAKITLPAAGTPVPTTFDDAQKSLGLIRAGDVSDEELKEPALFCAYQYVSLWDMWFRFQAVQILFFDLKKGNLVLKCGQYQDDPFSSEDGELDRLFAEIAGKFFPDRPNPFKGKK